MIGDIRHVITHITRTVTICVGLVLVGDLRTVILAVDDPVTVAVRTAWLARLYLRLRGDTEGWLRLG